MTFNHNAVDKILAAIFPLPEEFGLDNNTKPINFKLIQNQIKTVDACACINFGISKMVIISPDFNNVVIKIPFNGEFDENAEWLPFEWANGSSSSDYCLAEYEKYCRLKTYGLDCFVAKTIKYKTIDNVRIFIQEKVIPEEDTCFSNFTPSLKSKKLAQKWQEEGQSIFDTLWFANCLDKYGQSKVQRFLYYCNNIDLDILEDTHEGNYGYRENGTPVILDYSNFSH